MCVALCRTLPSLGSIAAYPYTRVARSLAREESSVNIMANLAITIQRLRTLVVGGSSQKEQVDALLFPTNFAGYHDALVNLPHLQNRSRNMAPQYISAKRGGCARPATLCRVMKVVKARLQSDVASMNDVVPHNPFSRSLHRAVQKCLPTRASNEI